MARGEFDRSDPVHLARLGDFAWEGDELSFKAWHRPRLDWTDVLRAAAAAPRVRGAVRRRGLLLLVGFHDDAVYDVS